MIGSASSGASRIAWALVLAALPSIAACGGPRTRVIDGHTMTFEGARDEAKLSVDGTPVRVVYDRVAGAYRAPGCDFGPAATLESLAEQVATTSPGTCEPLDGGAADDAPADGTSEGAPRE
ncbi:MAG: hypothetical protein M3Y87_30850 [Myxococcota bacterium]|nr:hypothetical protein [Myxococcota bacterium]